MVKVPPIICVGVSLFVAGGLGEGDGSLADFAEAELIGVVEDGDDEAAFEGDGDADIDLAVLDDGVVGPRRR